MQDFAEAKTRYPVPWWFFVYFVVCLLASGCAGTPKHPTWSNSTSAEQMERLMWHAVQEKDWSNFERRLSPTFIGVNADGQGFDRAGWLAFWKSAQVREAAVDDVSVQPEGADMKLSYTLHLHGQAPGLAAQGALRVVSVWQRIKERMVLTATAITPIR
jgi:uncharacterized protein DUF4440